MVRSSVSTTFSASSRSARTLTTTVRPNAVFPEESITNLLSSSTFPMSPRKVTSPAPASMVRFPSKAALLWMLDALKSTAPPAVCVSTVTLPTFSVTVVASTSTPPPTKRVAPSSSTVREATVSDVGSSPPPATAPPTVLSSTFPRSAVTARPNAPDTSSSNSTSPSTLSTATPPSITTSSLTVMSSSAVRLPARLMGLTAPVSTMLPSVVVTSAAMSRVVWAFKSMVSIPVKAASTVMKPSSRPVASMSNPPRVLVEAARILMRPSAPLF